MAPQVGLEPTTLRLTAGCSAIELLRSVCALRERSKYICIVAAPECRVKANGGVAERLTASIEDQLRGQRTADGENRGAVNNAMKTGPENRPEEHVPTKA